MICFLGYERNVITTGDRWFRNTHLRSFFPSTRKLLAVDILAGPLTTITWSLWYSYWITLRLWTHQECFLEKSKEPKGVMTSQEWQNGLHRNVTSSCFFLTLTSWISVTSSRGSSLLCVAMMIKYASSWIRLTKSTPNRFSDLLVLNWDLLYLRTSLCRLDTEFIILYVTRTVSSQI